MTQDSLPTAAEIAAEHDCRGQTVLITGATSGIGRETAVAFAQGGATLIFGVRDVAAGRVLADELPGADRAAVLRLELSDVASVENFAAHVRSQAARVDILVANAGVSKSPDPHTAQGLDVRFATNHLGHFLLAHRLYAQLAAAGAARIVVLSSAAHKGHPVRFDDLQWTSRPRNDLAAYGESKTANILFAMEASRRWRSVAGITANAVLPGAALTGLQRYHDEATKQRIGFVAADGSLSPRLRTPAQAAATTVWAALDESLAGRGGLVLEDCGRARPVDAHTDPWSGWDPAVTPTADAERLWETSLRLLEDLGAARNPAVP
jgi:NAD(P)-dependent dehydrogenase (short-subunit alcohol dehydrogenase family)